MLAIAGSLVACNNEGENKQTADSPATAPATVDTMTTTPATVDTTGAKVDTTGAKVDTTAAKK